MSSIELKSELTLFDVTNLVVGAIVGADIYVASSFGAGYDFLVVPDFAMFS